MNLTPHWGTKFLNINQIWCNIIYFCINNLKDNKTFPELVFLPSGIIIAYMKSQFSSWNSVFSSLSSFFLVVVISTISLFENCRCFIERRKKVVKKVMHTHVYSFESIHLWRENIQSKFYVSYVKLNRSIECLWLNYVIESITSLLFVLFFIYHVNWWTKYLSFELDTMNSIMKEVDILR
jgi:hypothetical protein